MGGRGFHLFSLTKYFSEEKKRKGSRFQRKSKVVDVPEREQFLTVYETVQFELDK